MADEGSRGALVTGAARGIGAATAQRLAEAGFEVCVSDLDQGACQAVAEQIGAKAWARRLDVTDAEQCRRAATEVVDRSGNLSLWVNNAGILHSGKAQDQEPDIYRSMLEVNTMGTINGTLAALAPMREAGRGHVINVVSLAGLVAAPGEVGYGASKHAAIAFSIGLLYDLRRSGIREIDISVICPDGVWSPMIADKVEDRDTAASFSGSILMPEDVARRIEAVAERPKVVTTIPRWRGVMLRIFDAFPGLGLRLLPVLLRDAERKQRKLARRVAAGKFPPA